VGSVRALAEAPLGELLAAWQGGFGCRSFEAFQRLVGFLGFVRRIIRTARSIGWAVFVSVTRVAK